MGWEAINDSFYEEHGDMYVVAWWNGITAGNHGKQETRFLTEKTPAYKYEHALSSAWADEAARFGTREAAETFLARQDKLRPHPLGAGWFVSKLKDIATVTGYRPNTREAILGNDETMTAAPGPR